MHRAPLADTASRPARVVLTGTFFADNWVEAHVRPLAAATRCEHTWVVSDRPFIPITKVTYVCAPSWLQKLIGRVPARSLLFMATAIRHRADIVGGFHLLFNGLLALMLARFIRARALWFCVGGWAEFVGGGVHGGNNLFNRISQADAVLERLFLDAIRQFDLILTMGTGARQYLLQRGVQAPIEVMSGGIDSRLFCNSEPDRPYDLITVSRIVPVKRLDVFLDVVRHVVERVPTLRAAVVGDGSELERLVRRSQRMGLDQHVSFVGRRTDVHRWLARARLFVLTSDSEGLALSLMEAMTAGLPAVVSDVGDLGDLVRNGVNGWRPPPGAVHDFAERIIALLTDDQLYRRAAHQARHSAMAYDLPAARAHWDTVFQRWGHAEVLRPSVHTHTNGWHLVRSRKRLWQKASTITRWPLPRPFALVPPAFWLGRRFRRNLDFVNRTQSWRPEQIEDYQLRLMRRIVTLAYQQSPFYRQRFRAYGFEPGDLRSLQAVTALPTIDANVVRSHLHEMCTEQSPRRNVDAISTGGTTGKPLRFFMNTDRSEIEYAYLVASWHRTGYILKTSLAVFRAKIVPEDSKGLRHTYDPVLRHHHYSVFHLNDRNMRRYLDHIRGIGPCFLHVYPSSVAALARFARRSNVQIPRNILGIIAESEIVYDDQRTMVEEVFGCRCFSCYGQTEKLVAAAECEYSTDYHVWPTYGYFELLDEDGNPVTTLGERGEIVGTGFINTAVPFIRYRTGDFATYVADQCEACGRQHTVLREIRGHRIQEVLIAGDGSQIPWAALNMHDDTFSHVRQFQFRQDTPGHAALRMVPAPGFTNHDREGILRNLQRKLDGRLTIAIELTGAIPLTRKSKTIYVDQRIIHTPHARP
jgi:phenylacetate-CoA ligase